MRGTGEDREEMPTFEVSTEHQAVRQCDAGAPASTISSGTLSTLAVCDVDLAHRSQISDDEDYPLPDGGCRPRRRTRRATAAAAPSNGASRMRCCVTGSNCAWSTWVRRPRSATVPGWATRYVRSVARVSRRCPPSASRRSSPRATWRGAGARWIESAFTPTSPPTSSPCRAFRSRRPPTGVLEALRFGAASVLDMHLDDLQVLVVGPGRPPRGERSAVGPDAGRFGSARSTRRTLRRSCPGRGGRCRRLRVRLRPLVHRLPCRRSGTATTTVISIERQRWSAYVNGGARWRFRTPFPLPRQPAASPPHSP